MQQSIGILGGAFDPIHNGHLAIAEAALSTFGLDEVILMPTAHSPLKASKPHVSDHHRLTLIAKAIHARPRLSVSGWEIQKGGTSYTIDTAKYLQSKYPGSKLSWIIGSDQASKLSSWKGITELGEILNFIAFPRPGLARTQAPEGVSLLWGPAVSEGVSSTEIRQSLASGRDCALFLPEEVLTCINAMQLYQ